MITIYFVCFAVSAIFGLILYLSFSSLWRKMFLWDYWHDRFMRANPRLISAFQIFSVKTEEAAAAVKCFNNALNNYKPVQP